MTEYVLDTSALVALIRKEPGWKKVASVISRCSMSTVNFAETVYILQRREMPLDAIRLTLEPLVPNPVDFGVDHAFRAASLITRTRHAGLSFGDCACLALAESTGAVALTAEKVWATLGDGLGVAVEAIR